MRQATGFSPYFGAKRQAAPLIIPFIGKHSSLLDPACGSMAVPMAMEPCALEIVSDLHGDITNLARVLQSKNLYTLLKDKLHRTMVCDKIMEKSNKFYQLSKRLTAPKKPDWERAYHAYVVWWMGRSGQAGTKNDGGKMAIRYTSNGGATARRFVTAVDSLDAFIDRLRPFQILNEDMFKLIPKWEDKKGAVLFLDAPYYDKGAEYLYDFTHEMHVLLRDMVREFKKTRVIICYYNHPVVRKLYKDWNVVELNVNKNIVQQHKRGELGATSAPELLFINQEVGL